MLRLPRRHWALLVNARNIVPRLKSPHESVKIRRSSGVWGEGKLERGREGEAFKEMWRTNYLSAKNALCPSKNSFDRIFWQAPAAQLFQALSGMCWCYFQTRGSTLDLRSEQKGLLWILDEESIFPGANDSSFLARLYVHHCNDSEYKIIHHSSNVCGLWEMPD